MEWAGGSDYWARIDVGRCGKIKENKKEGEGEEVRRGEDGPGWACCGCRLKEKKEGGGLG
jgi:hypothetical protein